MDPAVPTAELEVAAERAWWRGDGVASMAASEQLYRRLLADGRPDEAARQALRLALEWGARGDLGVVAGWMNRARRLLADLPTGPDHGYLAYLEAALVMDVEGDPGPARAAAVEIGRLAREHDDAALTCFSLVLSGMAAVREGRTQDGFGDLDEAMLPVLAGEVPPLWSGDVYCTVIHLCEALGDHARMRAWTDALQRWAAPLSSTFGYAGVARVHQLQLVGAEGDWDVVEAELGQRSDGLVGSHGWLAGAGYHALGDVRRLRGDLEGAREAYDDARSVGVDPQPGDALLERSRHGPGRALASLRAALAATGRLERARLLPDAVALALEAGDREGAGVLADEADATAATYDAPGLVAGAATARALVLLEQGRGDDALALLERAAAVHREQRHRYATAQVHEHLARARRQLGDNQAADADVACAVEIYRRLGAVPDVERLAPRALPGGLTAREAEVLTLVAGGASNRDVARTLVISEKTVSRHLANLFAKIGVSSRTRAAAWAREHDLAAAVAP